MTAELENNIVSVERLVEYSKVSYYYKLKFF